MKEITTIDILIGVVSLLTAIVSAFGAFLLRRMEAGNETLISIDKSLAVLTEKVYSLDKDVARLDGEIKQKAIEIIEVRMDCKEIGKQLSDIKK